MLKPLGLSASRGVIRANDRGGIRGGVPRASRKHAASDELQVESYIPGREFAVEGLMTRGQLQPLAIFDKPDPLEGPYFEETIYVTPSREAPGGAGGAASRPRRRRAAALGLRHGPVHAELRYNDEGAWMLEVHARPIGGLCAKRAPHGGGIPLEELILRARAGRKRVGMAAGGRAGVGRHDDSDPAQGGIYQGVDGVEAAQAVPDIEDVIITAKEGQMLVPLPEGASYLGFIFARGETPDAVETALRRSHAELRIPASRPRSRRSALRLRRRRNRAAAPRLRRRSTCPSAR